MVGRRGRLEPTRRADLVRSQACQQLGGRLLQEAGGKLVQQPTDLLGGVDEQPRLVLRAVADGLRTRLRMFERAGELRQVREPDGRRTAGQRMRERDRSRTGTRILDSREKK